MALKFGYIIRRLQFHNHLKDILYVEYEHSRVELIVKLPVFTVDGCFACHHN